jgi:hypothetical protein
VALFTGEILFAGRRNRVATKEHYNAKPMGVNASQNCGASIAGFLAVTAGTLTVTDNDGTVLVAALPVAAGGPFVRIPLLSRTSAGCVVSLAGGASGTLFS